MGDGRGEASSTIGDGRQAAIPLMPDVDSTDSGSLLDSTLFPLLKNERKKKSKDVWVVALFFLITDDIVAMDNVPNGCCNCVLFNVGILCLKNQQSAVCLNNMCKTTRKNLT